MNLSFLGAALAASLFLTPGHAMASTQCASHCSQNFGSCTLTCQGNLSCFKSCGATLKNCTAACTASLPNGNPFTTPFAPQPQQPSRAPDDAQYPTARVLAQVRSGCDSQNRSSALVLECGCMAREAERHLAAGNLARRTIAQQQFDVTPCIDRPRTADKVVALQFTAGTTSMMQSAGVDVQRLKACTHRAVAQDMPRESLTDYGNLRSELKLRCNSTGR